MILIQARMARAALGWTSLRLARKSNLSVMQVSRFFQGREISADDVRRIRAVFEEAGIGFEQERDRLGVWLKRQYETDTPQPSGPATNAVKAMDAAISEHKKRASRDRPIKALS